MEWQHKRPRTVDLPGAWLMGDFGVVLFRSRLFLLLRYQSDAF